MACNEFCVSLQQWVSLSTKIIQKEERKTCLDGFHFKVELYIHNVNRYADRLCPLMERFIFLV